MKKKSKKWAGVFSVLLSSSLVLSACGGQEEKASTEPAKQQDLKDLKIEKIAATDKKKSPEKANQRKDTFITAISKPGAFSYHTFKKTVGMVT